MIYKGWIIHTTLRQSQDAAPTEITATKAGEELTIRTTDMNLVKHTIRRRNRAVRPGRI